ncbi:MAG: hypothetical protein ACLSBB_18500 [Ruthenibacterium lactatiformans]
MSTVFVGCVCQLVAELPAQWTMRVIFSGVCSGLLNLAMACASSPTLWRQWTLNGAARSCVISTSRLTVEPCPVWMHGVTYSTTCLQR